MAEKDEHRLTSKKEFIGLLTALVGLITAIVILITIFSKEKDSLPNTNTQNEEKVKKPTDTMQHSLPVAKEGELPPKKGNGRSTGKKIDNTTLRDNREPGVYLKFPQTAGVVLKENMLKEIPSKEGDSSINERLYRIRDCINFILVRSINDTSHALNTTDIGKKIPTDDEE